MAKLDVRAFSLVCGILWGLSVLITGLTSTFWGYGTALVDFLSSFYLGYQATILGTLIGTLWAFFDGLITGLIFAWLYNKLAR